ncbi:natural killer cell receptor 2B4 isoform X2 [Hyaena hyaena]|uniref:natural killer cell receptor 2B4 isoform X2 n=1 Tax=Hyaena hyaena TaxID=95912 RepID=UPI001923C696|nr:natural killer cell receptor 2B4 isoform X2 [Hyaena hyaena]
MLGLALLLTLLFLKEHQGKEPSFCRVSAERVVGLSGVSLKLQPPPIETKKLIYVEWKRRVFPASKFSLILKWKNMSNCCNYENWTSNHINKKFNFITTNFSLIIQAAEHQDSGFYILAVTDEVGGVKCHEFEVSVFDHVGEPHILQDQKVLDGGRCQVILSCSVSRGGIVSYDWYRGSRLIETARNLSRLEDQIDANSSHTYTCNVSNSVSWVNHTFIQHCRSDSRHSKHEFLHLLGIIVVCLIILFLCALIGFCVWRRKRKQPESRPEEFLTVYEDVNNVQIRRNQEEKLNPPGEGNTIYSMIQSQPSASTSQETNTLYALVQTSRKSESKKSHRSSLNNTIYEEVGKRQLKAQNPGRLSRRELENFCVYS